MVNSAIYGNLAGKITTISKAMMMLGFEKVRMLSATLMIFEHLEDKSQAADLKEVAVESFINGVIAMNLAESMKFGRAEEAFVCAMLHNLGKMLVICYFPEEYAWIDNHGAFYIQYSYFYARRYSRFGERHSYTRFERRHKRLVKS